MRLPLLSLLSILALSACSITTTPEYPSGVKTNAVMGKSYSQADYPPRAASYTPDEGRGILNTKPAKGGGNAICVGAWCSCDTK